MKNAMAVGPLWNMTAEELLRHVATTHAADDPLVRRLSELLDEFVEEGRDPDEEQRLAIEAARKEGFAKGREDGWQEGLQVALNLIEIEEERLLEHPDPDDSSESAERSLNRIAKAIEGAHGFRCDDYVEPDELADWTDGDPPRKRAQKQAPKPSREKSVSALVRELIPIGGNALRKNLTAALKEKGKGASAISQELRRMIEARGELKEVNGTLFRER